MSRSRSPRTRTASTDVVVHSFINFCSNRFGNIQLLADKQVKPEKGPKHGSWELDEDDDLIIEWHFRGNAPQVQRHRYAQIPSTQAWQLMERDGDSVDNITFLLPVVVFQETTHAPLDFIHHAQSAPWRCGKFKPMALREDGSVKFDGVSPHGSWHREDNGDLVVLWHFNGDEAKIRNHRYHKLPYTDAWRLIYREGYSIQDVTLLMPITPVT